MKKLFLLTILSLSLVSCDRNDKPRDNDGKVEAPDNTGRNVRDRDSKAVTPLDQSENEGDRTITQRIRQAIVANKNLSTNAKNIKIVTVNGIVTLRGPVADSRERDMIGRIVNDTPGIVRVDNQLEITNVNN
jgi:hyperosmotically inducible protein